MIKYQSLNEKIDAIIKIQRRYIMTTSVINPNCLSTDPALQMESISNAITSNPVTTLSETIVNDLEIPYNLPLNENQFPITIITDATQAIIDSINNVYLSASQSIIPHIQSTYYYNSYIMQSNNNSCSWNHLSSTDIIMGIDVNDFTAQLTAVGYEYINAAAVSYQGSISGEGTWNSFELNSLNSKYVIQKSWSNGVMNGLAVGGIKYWTLDGVHAFLYDLNNTKAYSINYPGAVSTNARDIWYDGGDSYVVVGGYLNNPIEIVKTRNLETIDTVLNSGYGFMMRWNATSNTASNWKTFSQDNTPTPGVLSIFTRITTDNNGGYNLLAENFNQLTVNTSNIPAFINAIEYDQSLSQYTGHSDVSNVNVPTTSTNGFGTAVWTDYTVTQANSDESIGVTAAGIIGSTVFGTYNATGYTFEF